MRSLVGTGSLIRLALRRDRVIIPTFVASLAGMVAWGAYASVALLPDLASKTELATTINSASSMLAMYGPIHDPTSIGALSTFKMGMLGLIAMAIFGARIVVRHTRAEEETGRLEMLGATVVGRWAPLTAAVCVSVGASVVTGAATALGLIGAGMPATGSWILGTSYALMGVAFAGLGAVAAQVTTSARAAAGMATGALGVMFLIRAIGDASQGGTLAWISWVSPLGWCQKAQAYQGDRWWPLAPLLGLAVVLLLAAFALAVRRDFGAGLIADRSGRAAAAPWLRSPLALAWRLQRGSFYTWAISFLIVGAVIGGLTSTVGRLLDNPTMQDFLNRLGGVGVLADVFMSVEIGVAGLIAAVYGLQAVSRLRSEEVGLRAEPTLATAATRIRWAWSHLTIALAGSAALLVLVGVGAGLTSAAQVDTPHQFWRILGAALVQLPAVWVAVGIGAAAFGLFPRQYFIGWIALVVFMLIGEFGPLFKLPQWFMDLSPFAHTPRMPGGALTATPLIALAGVATGLIVLGLVSFRRRDLD